MTLLLLMCCSFFCLSLLYDFFNSLSNSSLPPSPPLTPSIHLPSNLLSLSTLTIPLTHTYTHTHIHLHTHTHTHTLTHTHTQSLAGALVAVLQEANQEVPQEIFKYPMVTKKKTSKVRTYVRSFFA